MPVRNASSRHGRAGLSRIGQRRQVVIPKRIFESLHLVEGDFMEISVAQRGVLMRPKKLVDAEDILTPSEARKVRKGEKQIQRRQLRAWSDVKHDLGG